MESEFDQLIFRARVLSSITRLDVWQCIGEAGMYSTEIEATLQLAPSTVSHHLAVLEHAGLIARRKQGRNVLCTVTDVRWGVVSQAEVEAMMQATPT